MIIVTIRRLIIHRPTGCHTGIRLILIPTTSNIRLTLHTWTGNKKALHAYLCMQGFCFFMIMSTADDSLESVHIVDYTPAATALFNAALPVFKPVHVFARIDVIAA